MAGVTVQGVVDMPVALPQNFQQVKLLTKFAAQSFIGHAFESISFKSCPYQY